MITIRPTPAPLLGFLRPLSPGRSNRSPAARAHPARRADGWIRNPTRSAVFSRGPGRVYRHRRASLRRVWLEPGPCPHAGLLSVLADDRDRLARGLAPDLRRGGRPGLGGVGHHD